MSTYPLFHVSTFIFNTFINFSPAAVISLLKYMKIIPKKSVNTIKITTYRIISLEIPLPKWNQLPKYKIY